MHMIDLAGNINSHRIKPIETKYKGYRFRSRLEARWAIFFDSLGISWEYEKEGYDLGDLGKYLPDFWMPHMVGVLANSGWGLWAEMKPYKIDIDSEPFKKVLSLAKNTKHNALIFQGYPKKDGYTVTKISATHFENPVIIEGLRFENDDGYIRLRVDDFPSYPAAYFGDLEKAYQKARSARFEHGEEP